jgi:tRNA threonylcarbamoyl adenosine modification protein (Sua5/YciO/YrdC/YwlC family)
MRIVTKNDIAKSKPKFIRDIQSGAVFIYPTDTIYGIGCDATNDNAVQKIRELKNRDKKPFSIIAPSIDWISENCVLSDKAKKWLLRLPGPYTLILEMSNPKVISAQTNMGMKTVGVRIPNHWIAELVSSFGKPIITTSVNLAGNPPAVTRQELEKFDVDFIIYEGDKRGKPSTIVDLTVDERLIKRQ